MLRYARGADISRQITNCQPVVIAGTTVTPPETLPARIVLSLPLWLDVQLDELKRTFKQRRLRFCDVGHNGGLCAAVPGPNFLVNTENGALGAAAHEIPAPGWHHFAGVYDGAEISLYIDGVLAARREGSGALINSPVDVEVGRIQKGAARFRGIIGEVRISDTARDADWLATAYKNLSDPAGFINILK